MESKIFYRTFHVLDEGMKEIGKITSAKQYDEDGSMVVSFAFCSPKDRYAKKHGQLIAGGRLMNKPKKRYRTYTTTLQEIKELALAVAQMKNIKWMGNARLLV